MADPVKMALSPNHTQIPNLYLDEAMRILTPAEFKVLMAISRLTFGWHQESVEASLQRLAGMTGLSRQGLINGLSRLTRDGLIEAAAGDCKAGEATLYRINLAWIPAVDKAVHNSTPQSTELTTPQSTELTPPSQLSRPLTPRAKETVKERDKEIKPAALKALAVDNSTEELASIFATARRIGGGDLGRTRSICAWIGRTVKMGLKNGDPPTATIPAVAATLAALEVRGQDPPTLWGYLEVTFTHKRTAAFEAVSGAYKKEEVGRLGNILEEIANKSRGNNGSTGR